jgi:predicted HicB family RNase H-like nuclease
MKHVYIENEIHKRVKDEAERAGMKLKPFIEQILEAGLDYKKFLSERNLQK